MGGMEDGALAAQAVVEGVAALRLPDVVGEAMERCLLEGLEELNGAMYHRWNRRGGATLALLAVDGEDMLVVTSGDSEAYLFRAGELLPIGTPHNEFARLLERGLVDPDDVAHPARSYLTAYMGMAAPWERCFNRVPAREGDLFLVCSDGICGMLTHGEIAEILAGIPQGEGRARAAAEGLAAAALEAGGFDNIAAAVLCAPPA